MKFDIEIADIDDIPEILAVQKLAFYNVAKEYNNFRLGPLQVTIQDLESSFEQYNYLKLVVDKNIVASSRTKVIDNKCKIENVIVHPDYQRKGVGRALIKSLEERENYSTFELCTGKNTPGNVDFYKSMGYEIVDEIPATDTVPLFVVMRKSFES